MRRVNIGVVLAFALAAHAQTSRGTVTGTVLDQSGAVVSSPVVNFRFNESRWRMVQNCIAIGKASRVRGDEGEGMIAPPLVVKDFPFTSVSDAV